MNKIIPLICSQVQTLLNNAKDKNSVMAFRAVDVMDIVSAPNSLVMRAEQELPKNPALENRQITRNFDHTPHDRDCTSEFDWISSNVPGVMRYDSPSFKSPLTAAAAMIPQTAIEYRL
mmetsp:Transcript_24973/g.31444  ORF Transcript_24973/g.31444 Transcript_24973/m.31444 type:complete len:118 (-) Transcript_24973:748-1101(-)